MTSTVEFSEPMPAYEGVRSPCPRCRGVINAGDQVRWESGEGRYWHDTCYQTATGGDGDRIVTSDGSSPVVQRIVLEIEIDRLTAVGDDYREVVEAVFAIPKMAAASGITVTLSAEDER